MFNSIASDYNRMNHLMTLGMDKKWRRYVVTRTCLQKKARLLDIATGTGDIIFEALSRNKIQAFALDFARSMLDVARNRDKNNEIAWIQGDALNLPFEDDSFDAVTSGYLIRNVGNISRAFSEQYRILKPGGTVVCLETSPPQNTIFKPLINIHFRLIIPFLGKWLTGSRTAYKYLTESTENFKTAEELQIIMEACGFKSVRIKQFMFRTIAVLSATKSGLPHED